MEIGDLFYLKYIPVEPSSMPKLRRTSRGVDVMLSEPMSCSDGKKKCRVGDALMMAGGWSHVAALTIPICESFFADVRLEWSDLRWIINRNTRDIKYWATSYMSGDHEYYNKEGIQHIVIRIKCSKIVFYCYAKFVVLAKRAQRNLARRKKLALCLRAMNYKYKNTPLSLLAGVNHTPAKSRIFKYLMNLELKEGKLVLNYV